MKNTLLILMLTAAFFAGCKDAVQCEAWEEGDDCTEMREKFLGTYNGTLTQDSIETPFNIVLTADSAKPYRIQTDRDIYLDISGSATVIIPPQTASWTTAMIFNGMGALNGDHFTLTGTVFDSITPYNFSFSGERQ